MERECNKCVHRKEHGCEKWDCEFEPFADPKEDGGSLVERHPREDAVSRQAVIKVAKGWWGKGVLTIDDIYKLPPVEPTRGKGKWIIDDKEYGRIWKCHCSKCGKDPQIYIGGSENWWLVRLPKYCPTCGKEMESEE